MQRQWEFRREGWLKRFLGSRINSTPLITEHEVREKESPVSPTQPPTYQISEQNAESFTEHSDTLTIPTTIHST